MRSMQGGSQDSDTEHKTVAMSQREIGIVPARLKSQLWSLSSDLRAVYVSWPNLEAPLHEMLAEALALRLIAMRRHMACALAEIARVQDVSKANIVGQDCIEVPKSLFLGPVWSALDMSAWIKPKLVPSLCIERSIIAKGRCS